MSQRDLSLFFENLSSTNQLLYTTHSPFLVDADHLDRVKAVYVDTRGHTAVSSDLRAGLPNDESSKSIYPVHAALGLSASEGLLQGCQVVIVEGQSDQLYLSAIKNALISRKKIAPKREMIFIPAGGVKGVRAVANIVTGKEEVLPYVLLDSDAAGKQLAKSLREDLYQTEPDRILEVGSFASLNEAEIEDLWPTKFYADVVTKFLRGPEEDFADVCSKEKKAVVPQVEAYAKKHGIPLKKPGWKVEIARSIKARFLNDPSLVSDGVPEAAMWVALFARLLALTPAPTAPTCGPTVATPSRG